MEQMNTTTPLSAPPPCDDDLSQFLRRKGTECLSENLLTDGFVLGPYRILGLLGRGGSAEVYRAERTDNGEVVALKVPRRRDDVETIERFRHEARLLAEHPHPALPHLIESGEADGIFWLAEEELSPRELPSKPHEVERLLLSLCRGIAHLHALGLVHRDIKPGNILYRADGTPVLIDLGLVKQSATAQSFPDSTEPLSVMDGHAVGHGTPGWAPPEQFSGGDISPAADVYALGLLALKCFSDHAPRLWRPLLTRATSPIPAERPADAATFAKALRQRRRPLWWRIAAATTGLAAAIVAASAFIRLKPPAAPISMEDDAPGETTAPPVPDVSISPAIPNPVEADESSAAVVPSDPIVPAVPADTPAPKAEGPFDLALNASRDILLTPLVGRMADGDRYWATPLVGTHEGQDGMSGSWFFPFWDMQSQDDTYDRKFLLISGTKRSDADTSSVWFHPIFSDRSDAAVNRLRAEMDSPTAPDIPSTGLEEQHDDDGQIASTNHFYEGDRASEGTDILLGLGGSRHTVELNPSKESLKLDIPAPDEDSPLSLFLYPPDTDVPNAVTRYLSTDENWFFPLWQDKRQRGVMFDIASGEKQLDAELETFSMLYFLYNWRHESIPEESHDYVRRRFLLYLYNYEKRGDEESTDIFPAISWDRRKDGYRKASFLWRVFRWERDPEKGTSIDFLFIPLWRP